MELGVCFYVGFSNVVGLKRTESEGPFAAALRAHRLHATHEPLALTGWPSGQTLLEVLR